MTLKGQEFFSLILTGGIFNKKLKALTDPAQMLFISKNRKFPFTALFKFFVDFVDFCRCKPFCR
jgi:hypothetical protein